MVIKALDPDWIRIRIGIQPKMLDPDPDEINADPQPWPQLSRKHQIQGKRGTNRSILEKKIKEDIRRKKIKKQDNGERYENSSEEEDQRRRNN